MDSNHHGVEEERLRASMSATGPTDVPADAPPAAADEPRNNSRRKLSDVSHKILTKVSECG